MTTQTDKITSAELMQEFEAAWDDDLGYTILFQGIAPILKWAFVVSMIVSAFNKMLGTAIPTASWECVGMLLLTGLAWLCTFLPFWFENRHRVVSISDEE